MTRKDELSNCTRNRLRKKSEGPVKCTDLNYVIKPSRKLLEVNDLEGSSLLHRQFINCRNINKNPSVCESVSHSVSNFKNIVCRDVTDRQV